MATLRSSWPLIYAFSEGSAEEIGDLSGAFLDGIGRWILGLLVSI